MSCEKLLITTRMYFRKFQQGLPPDRGVGHTIPLEPNAKPPFRLIFRLSPNEMEEAKKQQLFVAVGHADGGQKPLAVHCLIVTS
eukprot:1112870-Pelagomonas_calceolata.AAC.2